MVTYSEEKRIQLERQLSDLIKSKKLSEADELFAKEILPFVDEQDKYLTEVYRCDIFEMTNSGIYSLSEVNDSILMWSHYGDSHCGICIGFDKGEFDETGRLVKVEYVNSLPDADPRYLPSDPELEYFRYKYSAWSYEKEWRYLHNESDLAIRSPATIKSVFFGVRVDHSLISDYCRLIPDEIEKYQGIMDSNSFKISFDKICV